MRKAIVSASAIAVALVFGCAPALAGNTVNTGYFGGVAILGYDPVAYFTEGRPVKGSAEFSYDWLGTPWHFASRKNQELFQSAPVKYAPQFGGYCAGEIAAEGITVNIDPEAWKIIDGKLYLVYNKGYDEQFAAEARDLVPKADANWPKLEANLNQGKYY